MEALFRPARRLRCHPNGPRTLFEDKLLVGTVRDIESAIDGVSDNV